MAGEAIESRQAVSNVVGFWRLLRQFVEVLAGAYVVSDVHQGNGVVVVFLRILELVNSALRLLVARVQWTAVRSASSLLAPEITFCR